MADYLDRWKSELIRQGRRDGEVVQALAEQQRIQATLGYISDDEAQLVSLLRMGAHFSLEQQPLDARAHLKVVLLLFAQFTLSQLPRFLGYPLNDATSGLYGLNMSFLVFPFLAIYHGWGQTRLVFSYLLASAILALSVNMLFVGKAHTQSPTVVLAIIHLPLFFILSLALFGTRSCLVENMWTHVSLVEETLLLTFLLLCATGFSVMLAILLFEAIGWGVEDQVVTVTITGIVPLLPLLSLHLLTTKGAKLQQLIRLLTTLFLPVFTLLMAAFLLVLLFGTGAVVEDRSLLLAIDILLAVLLLMILYATGLLEHQQRLRLWRGLIILSSTIALALDIVALRAIGTRLVQYGLTANRLAVLAQNILLCANLMAMVVTLLSRRSIVRMQAGFLLLYGAWFLSVVLIFPLLF
ncbi:MAG: hypothetical protein RBS49_08580 [Sphaerochaeta sp.]|jgi:hypothetical protein|nr:hypothetical protein [Sphaerochaeta sp.]